MDDTRSSPDRDLVDAVLANRQGAFERLVREHQGLCWHIIQRMVRNPEDARELCQDTFLRVHQCLHQYRYESALKSWIGRIAYTIALRHLQHKRIPLVDHGGDSDDYALVENIGDGFDLEAACADEETARHLHAAIEQLPPLQRTLLTLYYLEETSIPEIARITGLASGTIKSHLFRSRLRLRSALETRTGVAA
ncbi:RNA polymerase subunit sigma-24 [Rhodanobacter sp. FW510-R12]|uniref:RNA polymerase sigma factor n=1 Tax=unclassified Rhodanobacter TaxID=2621553 RepID=UPI0007A9FEBD|nr:MULTISPECIES: sigma-70 family RNA polymerase sigma factor [unclassified Rhodanobacter]KZC17728.1 RNA polymerase subunit sigma-24 [Rhodanobacter sp. FW104-R8]KZC27990.1 RNA polymerase subunit sigma-24 [Rhodanobacter sp. FW510-T8]KZC29908.1 RNA polymerase subunit sigma-24 [Rhodanobacter sp. FW510-R10]